MLLKSLFLFADMVLRHELNTDLQLKISLVASAGRYDINAMLLVFSFHEVKPSLQA